MSWLEATYRNPLKRVVGLDKAWLAVGAILLAIALLAGERLGGFLLFTGEQLLATAPFILFAVLLVAYLKASGAEATIARAFEGRETRMIVFAALLGGLAPFCSCEVIPFVAGLLAMGTPLSAVMAFWLSSPLIDPPALLITAGALGWPSPPARSAGPSRWLRPWPRSPWGCSAASPSRPRPGPAGFLIRCARASPAAAAAAVLRPSTDARSGGSGARRRAARPSATRPGSTRISC
jgi:hypothetical protein